MQPMFNKAHIATRGTAMIEQVRAMVGAWRDGEDRDVYADMNDITLAAFLLPRRPVRHRPAGAPAGPRRHSPHA
ncbi:hypothetical protein SSP24_00240 [Streptomyces spinoverrucosus]|uniref:Uncharacterized protein n=1 Tax=Streptomyces spinoverrucosus TaxID=284043 RepID=A0A4Y3V9Q0_9ACTN|nr:hypothetical protein SSP24_00240 [Streptomyces spinoverrucosus]GHB43457.1 hypothetical protein GCM10010397_12350 [Streptomyces spinoverrucosus]